MTLETTEQSRRKGRSAKVIAYDTVVIILTGLTAYVLSFYGYIPFDPITATISGCLVGLVYVCFHNIYGATIWRRSWATIRESQEAAELNSAKGME